MGIDIGVMTYNEELYYEYLFWDKMLGFAIGLPTKSKTHLPYTIEHIRKKNRKMRKLLLFINEKEDPPVPDLGEFKEIVGQRWGNLWVGSSVLEFTQKYEFYTPGDIRNKILPYYDALSKIDGPSKTNAKWLFNFMNFLVKNNCMLYPA